MAITTQAKVLSVLGLPATEGDLVDILIPLVEADYLRIRNRPFDTGDILTITDPAAVGGDITVTVAGNDYAVEVGAGDSEEVVARKVYLRLKALRRYHVSLSGDSVSILSDLAVFAFDGGTTGVTADTSGITTLYPTGAEYTAIKMIQYQLTAGHAVGLSSESLGDHSVVYDTGLGTRVEDYPHSVVGGIARSVSW